jgi:hypothetical protein
MLARLRRSCSFANLTAATALFIALGGTSYAAITIPQHSVGSAQLRTNAVTSAKVKDHSLLSKDFKSGQLPAGPAGPQGPKGKDGTADTPQQLLTKLQDVDGSGSGLDADTVDGQSSETFAKTSRFTFGQGRADASDIVLGTHPQLGVTVKTAGTGKAQIVVTNTRSSGNIIGVFQLYAKAPVPFSANPGQTVTTGDATVSALNAGHFTVTITDQDLARSYQLDCLASAIGGNPIVRCFGTTSGV